MGSPIVKTAELLWSIWASQVVLVVKNPPAKARDLGDTDSIPGLGRSPGGGHGNPFQYSHLEKGTGTHSSILTWGRAREPTPVFSPGESHGQRSLAGYSPWCCRLGHTWSDLARLPCGVLGSHEYPGSSPQCHSSVTS